MLEENKEMVKRIYKAIWNEQNMAFIADHFAGDFLGHATVEIHGPSGLLPWVTTLLDALPNGEFIIRDQIAEGDKVATRWVARGVQSGEFEGLPPTGKIVSITGIDLFRIAHGKIIEAWSHVIRQSVAIATPAEQLEENG